MEGSLVITQPKPDPRASGEVVCRYCSRKFKSLASLRPHLRACDGRWFDREIVLDGRHYLFKCNHNRKAEAALKQFAEQIVISVKTPEDRHRSLSSGLVLLQFMEIIKDLSVEVVGQTPAQASAADRVPAPAASPGTFPGLAATPTPAGTFPEPGELERAERVSPSLVKAVIEGRITPGEFRERVEIQKRRMR